MTEKIKIAIADDHKMFVDGLTSILDEYPAFEVIFTSDNGKDLLLKMKGNLPDIVILDITMPELNGEKAAIEIKRKYPGMQILMITMHQSADYILPLVDMGVQGFVLKNTERSELIAALQALSQGRKYYTEEVIRCISRRNIKEEEETIQLTKREREILQMLYEGLSSSEMAERLFISTFTVFTHRRNLLIKTNTKNATQLVNMAIGKGWVRLENH